jgi:sugar O-acyltransferase (sialic acid O-acetyltransferase NeuD family)
MTSEAMSAQKPKPLVIVGAGRQGRNIHDICQVAGTPIRGFLDDTRSPGETVNNIPILGPFARAHEKKLLADSDWIVGLGDNEIRRRLSHDIRANGGRLATIIHPTCIISPSARIGVGVYINALSRVLANVVIGDFALIEGLSSIGTDSVLEEAVLIGSGCQLIAGSHLGTCALLGAGAVVVRQAHIGAYSKIGAGATVIGDIPERVLAVGIPAKVKKRLP